LNKVPACSIERRAGRKRQDSDTGAAMAGKQEAVAVDADQECISERLSRRAWLGR
jgi:hypothetical protein